MHLTKFIAPIDLRAVFAYLSVVLKLLGGILAPPIIVALVAREFLYVAIFGILALSAYGLGRIGSRGPRPVLALKEALVVTALAYLLFAFVGGLAFLPVASLLDGFFEAMSGFTTTGISLLDVESLPTSLLFFRAYTQWVGGAGIIVLSVVVLAGPGSTAFQLYAAEVGGENLVGSVVATARMVTKIYAVLTGIGFLIFGFAGMSPFDAFLHAMATISTGGFSPYTQSIGHYQSPWIHLGAIAGMTLGAISFPLFYQFRLAGPKSLWQDLQARSLGIILILATVLLLGTWQWNTSSLLPSLFQAASAVTTTGFNESNAALWPEGTLILCIVLMIIGGSAGSTAGGIKLLRLILLLRVAGWLLIRHLLPKEATLPVRYGKVIVSENELKELFGFLTLYMIFFLLASVALVAAGFPASKAFFESASALGTVGLTSGITSPEAAPGVKLLLIFLMWIGRLEILPVLVLFYPGTWRFQRRRRSA